MEIHEERRLQVREFSGFEKKLINNHHLRDFDTGAFLIKAEEEGIP